MHGELDAAITRCEEAVTVALRNILTDPMLMLRLGPTIGLPIVLLYMSTLLVRAAELSLARADRVRPFRFPTSWAPLLLPSLYCLPSMKAARDLQSCYLACSNNPSPSFLSFARMSALLTQEVALQIKDLSPAG